MVKINRVYIDESGKVTIPEGVTTIGDSAFKNCNQLKTIPNIYIWIMKLLSHFLKIVNIMIFYFLL